MSINMSGSDDLEYADHEVQSLNLRLNVTGGDDAGGDYIYNTEPVSERGIESDELAELVAMYRTATLFIDDEQDGGQAEPGQGKSEAALGINLSPDELPTRAAEAGQEVTDDPATVVVSDQDEGTLNVANFEEPGVLDVSRFMVKPGFEGGGGGGSGDQTGTTERYLNFKHEFGTGPFLDRTDDLSVAAEVEVENLDEEVDVQYEVSYILYWAVTEQPDGRASFARP